MMMVRALLAWFLILLLAILNGAFRVGFLILWLGETGGHIISTLLLLSLVLLASWILIPWVQPASTRDAWYIGVFWVFLTLSFEFLAGHFLFGQTWDRLIADYDLVDGRIWIFVPIITLLAPVLVFNMRASNP
jgi:hypothetical protein